MSNPKRSLMIIFVTLFVLAACKIGGPGPMPEPTPITISSSTPGIQFPVADGSEFTPNPTEEPTHAPTATPIIGEPAVLRCWMSRTIGTEWSYSVTVQDETKGFSGSCEDREWILPYTAEIPKTAVFSGNGREITIVVVLDLYREAHGLFEGLGKLVCDGKYVALKHVYGYDVQFGSKIECEFEDGTVVTVEVEVAQ